MPTDASHRLPSVLRSEVSLWIGTATTALFLVFGDAWVADLSNVLWYSALFAWLFVVMIWLAFGVVRHADALAIKLGEPYGTIILTLSVICIEVVMISAVMLTGEGSPTVARDTLLSVLMIVLNGMLGVTLLVGGIRHREQSYNLRGASSYLGVIIPLAGIGLILPRFMTGAPGGEVTSLVGVWLIVSSSVLYVAFLWIQAERHSVFFEQPQPHDGATEVCTDHHGNLLVRTLRHHAVFLPLTMLPIVLLSKKMAVMVDHGIATLSGPEALGGFLVAVLVLSPEGMAAVKSALANQLQRTVNIALGSALSTIGLTIPAI
ncbi:MAG: calcium:proton antiporter, partial [Myxococcales bacterium]|nr:calcium:proton antiporter [Myxococcales bacterium]